jgi:hypothetical protein
MKPLLILAGLVLAAGAGAAGGALVAPASRVAAEPLSPSTPANAPAVAVTPEVQRKIDALHMEIADLQDKITQLSGQRTPGVAAPVTEKVVVDDSPEVFAAVHREAILKVIADQRAEDERKREEERVRRDQEQMAQRVDRVAQKYNLNEGQKHQLTDFYTAERQKFDDMRTQVRDLGADAGQNSMRDGFREIQAWRTAELTRLFGTELGAQIGENEGDRFRAAGGGPGGGGRRGQNGQGGQGGQQGGQNGQGGQFTAPHPPGSGQ